VATLGEALPQKSDQVIHGTKLGLLSRVYLLDRPFHSACCALTNSPKLNYKRSAHDEFRIVPVPSLSVDISWSSCRFFVRRGLSSGNLHFIGSVGH
jgi:hypothetical protein